MQELLSPIMLWDVNSRQIIQKIKASSNFLVDSEPINSNQINTVLKKGDVKCVVIFPSRFWQ